MNDRIMKMVKSEDMEMSRLGVKLLMEEPPEEFLYGRLLETYDVELCTRHRGLMYTNGVKSVTFLHTMILMDYTDHMMKDVNLRYRKIINL